MGRKGDEAIKSGPAMQLYADGHTLEHISEVLDISVTSLARWKEKSRVPGEELDGWDIARKQKRGNIQRLRDLFEDQLRYMEGLNAAERTAPMMDTLSKMGALVERWDKAEQVVRRLTQQGRKGADETKDVTIDAATIRDLREQFGL